MQYSRDKPLDNIELCIYPGQDTEYILYEDEGDNYYYKDGKLSTIRFKNSEEGNRLTVDNIQGEFKGMLKYRSIQAGIVSEGVAVGIEKISSPDTVNYYGKKLEIALTSSI